MDFTYNSTLVVLSVAVAILGSFTGLVMTAGIRRAPRAEVRLRLLLGGIGIGGGVWSMHFIAMLAVKLPIELSYDATPTIVSALIAIVGTIFALAIVSEQKFGSVTLPLSAVLLGMGIAGMHYLGMYALRGNCIIQYSWLGVSISVLIAIQASGVALWFAFRQRGVLDTFIGSIVLGMTIALMHYAGMEATRFLPSNGTVVLPSVLLSEKYLALAVAVTIYSVCCTCLFVFSVLALRARQRS